MTRDVFDTLGELDQYGRFEFSDEAWAHVRSIVKEKLGRDVDSITITVTFFDESSEVPLRKHVEIAIGLYYFKCEFSNRYPLQTARQILPELRHVARLLRDLLRSLKEPETALYAFDWGGDRGGPKSSILFVENQLRHVTARIDWLSRLFPPNEPFPGVAAPRDVAPTEGWQRHHHEIADDPEGALIDRLLTIYEQAFDRKPAISEAGPTFHFLRAVLRPILTDLTDGRIRYQLRRTL